MVEEIDIWRYVKITVRISLRDWSRIVEPKKEGDLPTEQDKVRWQLDINWIPKRITVRQPDDGKQHFNDSESLNLNWRKANVVNIIEPLMHTIFIKTTKNFWKESHYNEHLAVSYKNNNRFCILEGSFHQTTERSTRQWSMHIARNCSSSPVTFHLFIHLVFFGLFS